jgi:hypothetical protein
MAFAACSVCRAAQDERFDVTGRIEYLGTPYKERYPLDNQLYARNVWDMAAFDGKLFLGAGNSSNSGPASNAGPVPIIEYDPHSNVFTPVFVVDEEQIDIFYTFKGRLYVPGNDPREGWDLGNYYTLDPGAAWVKHRNIPNGIHTYALALHQGRLYAALGTNNKDTLAVSDDLGLNWKTLKINKYRIYNFLVVDDQIYTFASLLSGGFEKKFKENGAQLITSVHEIKDHRIIIGRQDLSSSENIFPDTHLEKINTVKTMRSATFKSKSIYIGAWEHNDHQSLPVGVFVASSFKKDKLVIEKIPLPKGTIPWDILVKDDTVYILTETRRANSTEVSVWQSNDTKAWRELFFFSAATFARSFEILDEYWYFSLGGEQTQKGEMPSYNLSTSTGEILRLLKNVQ